MLLMTEIHWYFPVSLEQYGMFSYILKSSEFFEQLSQYQVLMAAVSYPIFVCEVSQWEKWNRFRLQFCYLQFACQLLY